MNLTKFGNAFATTFSLGFIICMLVFSDAIMDRALVPRYISLAFLLLSGCVYLVFTKKKKQLELDFTLIVYGLFLLFTLASCLWALNFSEAIFHATKKVLGGLVFYAVIIGCKAESFQYRKELLLKRFAWMAALTFFILSLVAAYQYYQISTDTGGELNLRTHLTGLNSNKNLLSSAIYLLLILVLAGSQPSARKQGRRLLIIASIMAVVLVFLGTRAVMLGLGAATVFYVIFYFIRKRNYLVPGLSAAITMIAAVWILLPGQNKDGTALLDRTSLDTRIEIWDKSMPMFTDHPLTGVGAGNWKIHFPAYWQGSLENVNAQFTIFQTPHNDFLQVLLEQGLVGFLLLIFFMAALLVRSIKHFRAEEHSNALSLILLSFLSGYAVISMMDFPAQRIEHQVLSNILLAFLYLETENSVPGRTWQLKMKGLALAPFMAFLLLCIAIGVLRYRGEFYNKKIPQYRLQQNQHQIVRYADKATSVFYQLDPSSIPVNWYKGNALARLGETEAAYDAFRRALQQHPYQINVIGDMATAASLLGENEKAKSLYKEALIIFPTYDKARENLSVIALNEGNIDEAVGYMEGMSVKAREEMFSALIQQSPVPVYSSQVKELFTRALPHTENIDYLKVKMGTMYYRQGQMNDAVFWLTSASSLTLEKIDILGRLARQYESIGQLDKKEEIIEKLSQAEPADNAISLFIIKQLVISNSYPEAKKMLENMSGAISGREQHERDSLLTVIRGMN